MSWPTEAEYLYWRDICAGKYAKPASQPKPVTLDDIIRAVDGFNRGMDALDQLTKPFFDGLAEAERLFAQSSTGKVLAVLMGQRAAGRR